VTDRIITGDHIRQAIETASAQGQVDKEGRPLLQWVAIIALGPAGVLISEGVRRAIEEQIERWWGENR